MSKRTSAREFALRVLFQVDVGKLTPDEALETAFEQVKPGEEDRRIVDELVRGAAQEEETLDCIITGLAEGWRLDRLAKVDKNVLRIALYELIHRPDLPPSGIVNDAVEVVKKYSTEDSGRFVNGILASFIRQRGQASDQAAELGAADGKDT